MPAHEELSQLNYPANSSGVQAAHICHTQVGSAVVLGVHSALNGAGSSSDLYQTAESPWEWQWREPGGLGRGGFAAFPVGWPGCLCVEDPHVGTNKTRPRRRRRCVQPALPGAWFCSSGWRSCRQEGSRCHGPAQKVGAPARARGEPGLCPDLESCSSQHSREQGRRISIHLPPRYAWGSKSSACHFIALC